jgi:hypothetical protein
MIGIKKLEKWIIERPAAKHADRSREQHLSSIRLGFMTRSDDLLYQFSQTLRTRDDHHTRLPGDTRD